MHKNPTDDSDKTGEVLVSPMGKFPPLANLASYAAKLHISDSTKANKNQTKTVPTVVICVMLQNWGDVTCIETH
jgi:hypothetical protein